MRLPNKFNNKYGDSMDELELYLNDFADEQIKKNVKKAVAIRHTHEKGANVTYINVADDNNIYQKSKGNYVTIECQKDHGNEEVISKYVLKIMRKNGYKKTDHVLVVGLGNDAYLSDALGPKVIKNINVTSHFYPKKKATQVSCFIPGVMAMTGLESAQMIKSMVKEFDIDFVIVIDSLATRDMKRLYKTYQITDTGLNPGSGIKNRRLAVNKNLLHVPVIAIGVATVVDSASLFINTLAEIDKNYLHKLNVTKLYGTLYHEKYNFILTSKEIDELIDVIALNIARGINLSLNPKLPLNDKIR